jgi:hypothetical protein
MSQKDSITLLYSQMVQLQGLNLSQALETLLETGHIFLRPQEGLNLALLPL